jgi:hypothetical protein
VTPFGKPHADLGGTEGGCASRADEGHEDEQSGSRTVHEHPPDWRPIGDRYHARRVADMHRRGRGASRRGLGCSRNPRAGCADARRAAFWLHRSAANRAVAAHADSVSSRDTVTAPSHGEYTAWRARRLAPALLPLSAVASHLEEASRWHDDHHRSGANRCQPDSGRRAAQTTGPGSSLGRLRLRTGPTCRRRPLRCSRAAGRRRPRGAGDRTILRSRPA